MGGDADLATAGFWGLTTDEELDCGDGYCGSVWVRRSPVGYLQDNPLLKDVRVISVIKNGIVAVVSPGA